MPSAADEHNGDVFRVQSRQLDIGENIAFVERRNYAAIGELAAHAVDHHARIVAQVTPRLREQGDDDGL